jgi:hypothetical protein
MRMSKQDRQACDRFVNRVNTETSVGKDMAMLRDLVGALTDAAAKGGFEGKSAAGHLSIFSDILDQMENGKLLSMTERQRGYAKTVHSKYCSSESYRNDWSAGRVAKGRDVPLPEVLRPENLPRKPPQRRAP